MSERREHERFALPARIEVRGSGHVATLAAINISAGGILLLNEQGLEFTIGEHIRVHLDIPELAPAFAIEATVVRIVAATTKPAALAAIWTSSDTTATQALGQMLWNLKR